MATIRELKRRIKSAKNIGQVTRALEMVSAVKMRKAQAESLAGRPYTDNLTAAIRTLTRTSGLNHPYLRRPKNIAKIMLVIVAPHKGLAGSMLTNLTRKVLNFTDQVKSGKLVIEGEDFSPLLSDNPVIEIATWGKKARSIAMKTGNAIVADFYAEAHVPTAEHIKALAKFATDNFKKGEVDLVVIAFSQFINTMTQDPVIRRCLPLISAPTSQSELGPLYVFEPDPSALLAALMDHYIERMFNQIILDCFAAEHSARMVAMKNAHDNAEDIVSDFTLMYNNTRQTLITNEIADIISGSMISN